MTETTGMAMPAVTRLEVIDQDGRLFVRFPIGELRLLTQDDGRTLELVCRAKREPWPSDMDVDDDSRIEALESALRGLLDALAMEPLETAAAAHKAKSVLEET